MPSHRDVWIFDDLESIAVYYPELEEDRCILNTQTVFVDYRTSRIAKKNAAIEQIALGNYDIKDPNFLLNNDQNQAVSSRDQDIMSQTLPFYLFPDSHEEYLKAVQWSRYLRKSGLKPGNTLFHSEFYQTYDSGGTEIDRGWFKKKQFFFPDKDNNRAIFIRNISHVGEQSAGSPDEYGLESTGYEPDIRNDATARIHSPLAYFPPFIDYGNKDVPVLWNPSDPDGSALSIIQKYANKGVRESAWANALVAACMSKNKYITYDQIIKSSGKYGYNITVDLSLVGLGVYEWDFEHDMTRFFDPIPFFTEISRELLDNGNIVRWGSAGCNLSNTKNIGVANNPWGMPVTYQFDIDDPELRYYGLAPGAFQARDSWVHSFLVGGMIPICNPDFSMIHYRRHSKFGSEEPCESSGKYLKFTPHHQSALEIFKGILGKILGLGISFGLSFVSAAEGLSTASKIIGATISVFKQLSNDILSSAGASPLIISAFNYGLYEVCALKIEKTIKEGKDYQQAKKEIKQSLANTITRFSLGISSEEEATNIDQAERLSDIIVDYLTKEENKYAPHAKESKRKILASIAEAKENYLKHVGDNKYASGIKGTIQVIEGMETIDTGKSTVSSIVKIAAAAAGAVILAKYLRGK